MRAGRLVELAPADQILRGTEARDMDLHGASDASPSGEHRGRNAADCGGAICIYLYAL
jgi:hypothetical protein